MRREQYIRPIRLATATLAILIALRTDEAMGQNASRISSANAIMVDEGILAAFVDEPRRHFDAAQDAFLRRQYGQTAQHLRIASAFMQLESARATANGQSLLNASIMELQDLAVSIESNQGLTLQDIRQAFTRAHYALAGHFCIRCNHRCCESAAFENNQEMTGVGQDLQAAAIHLQQGALWTGVKPDCEIAEALSVSRLLANQLMQAGEVPQSEVAMAIRSVRDRPQDLTGRDIMLAPPIGSDDRLGPSLVR